MVTDHVEVASKEQTERFLVSRLTMPSTVNPHQFFEHLTTGTLRRRCTHTVHVRLSVINGASILTPTVVA